MSFSLFRDMPHLSIVIDGNESSIMRDVLAIAVRNEIARIPEAEIVCIDYLNDDQNNSFPNANLNDLVTGKTVEIKAGNSTDTQTIFKGRIIKIAQKLHQSNGLQVIFTLKHDAYKLTLNRKNRIFTDQSDSDIFKSITSEYNLTTDADDTGNSHDKMVQFNLSDWDFLNLRAEANSLLVIADTEKLLFKKTSSGQTPVVSLRAGNTLLDLEVELDSRQEFTTYKAKVWNASEQETKNIELPSATFGSPGGTASTGQLANETANLPFYLHLPSNLSEDETEKLLKSRILQNNYSKLSGVAKCIGTTSVKPGDLVMLEGIGSRLSGNAFVSGVLQSYNLQNGWQTTLQLGLDKNLFINRFNNVVLPSSAGCNSPADGLQTAVVTALEGDPANEFRIKIKLPLFGIDNEIWARKAFLDAGNERGLAFLPEIGDEVVVGFLDNDPRQAIVLGSLYSSTIPLPNTLKDDNFLKGFYSKKKLKLEFDDEKGCINIVTEKSQKIVLDDDGDKISIEDSNDNKIMLSSDGISFQSPKNITIQSSQGDLSIEGINVNIKASAQFKAEGSAGTEISSSAVTNVKGSIVNIN